MLERGLPSTVSPIEALPPEIMVNPGAGSEMRSICSGFLDSGAWASCLRWRS